MKTSVLFFVGFFLLSYVGAKPQKALNTVGKDISNIATNITKRNEEILKTSWHDIVNVLPIDETQEYYNKLRKSRQGMAIMDMISGKDLQRILEKIKESPAYKMLMEYYDKIIECYEMIMNNIRSQAMKIIRH